MVMSRAAFLYVEVVYKPCVEEAVTVADATSSRAVQPHLPRRYWIRATVSCANFAFLASTYQYHDLSGGGGAGAV
jgi:hypothetical protein